MVAGLTSIVALFYTDPLCCRYGIEVWVIIKASIAVNLIHTSRASLQIVGTKLTVSRNTIRSDDIVGHAMQAFIYVAV